MFIIIQLVWIVFHATRCIFIIEPCHMVFVEVIKTRSSPDDENFASFLSIKALSNHNIHVGPSNHIIKSFHISLSPWSKCLSPFKMYHLVLFYISQTYIYIFIEQLIEI